MKKTNSDISQKVKNAFDNSVPNVLDSILKNCDSEKGRIITMTEKKSASKLTKTLITAAACLALMLIGIGGFIIHNKNNGVAITVTIDVNPSVEIEVDEQEKVVDVIPLNRDALDVIGNMNFKGSNIEVTVNAIVGSMYSKGYLDYDSNTILLSIQSDDGALCERLTQEVNDLMKNEVFEGSLISQIVTNDQELISLAEEYKISVGKVNLVNTILGLYPERTFEELSSLPLTNLCAMLREGNLTDSGIIINSIKNVNFIGEEAALKKLIYHYKSMGVGQDHIKDISVKLGVYEGTAVYKIKHRFEYYNGSFSAISNPTTGINAVTGEFVDIYDLGPAENQLLTHWIDVPEGHFTLEDARKAIMEKYDLADEKSVRFMESQLTVRIDETTDKNSPITELGDVLKYYYRVYKDGWIYNVVFSSDNGEVLEQSREIHEYIIK